ncbi:MAG: type I restriction endonuclease [Flavobacteriales bacterium AspAUS03]
MQNGYLITNNELYELLILGKIFQQDILGDKKSHSIMYTDWDDPKNNVYHLTEEFTVVRSRRTNTYCQDIILFVNDIHLIIIECKSPRIKDPIE